MSAILRSCTPEDFGRLLPVLDEEFIYGKGRNHSLAVRFPGVFCAANLSNIYLVEEDGHILSALAVRHFDWHAQGQAFRGAMIGSVITRSERQGQGWGSRLLASTELALRVEGLDFAVLWTAQPEFYARLEWLSLDGGMFGEMSGEIVDAGVLTDVRLMPLADADFMQIENLRQRYCADRMPRRAEDYGHIPVPANSVELLWWHDGKNAAYALVGNAGETGIVYEMLGAEQGFASLVASIRARYRLVYVNDAQSNASYGWLTNHTDIRWQEKPLTMWRPLSDRVKPEQLSQWYIPYFDRI